MARSPCCLSVRNLAIGSVGLAELAASILGLLLDDSADGRIGTGRDFVRALYDALVEIRVRQNI